MSKHVIIKKNYTVIVFQLALCDISFLFLEKNRFKYIIIDFLCINTFCLKLLYYYIEYF